MERERLEDGRRRRRSRRLLLEVIASSFMEHSLNNFIIHFRSVIDQSTTLSLSFGTLFYCLCMCVSVRKRGINLWFGWVCTAMESLRKGEYQFLFLLLLFFGWCPKNKNIQLIWNFSFRVRVGCICLAPPSSHSPSTTRLFLRARFFFILFFFTVLAEKFSFMFLLPSRLNNMLPLFFFIWFFSLSSSALFSLSRSLC